MDRPVPTLGIPQNTIAVLNKYQFVFQKKYGQNFLIDPHVLDKIIRAARIEPEDFIVDDNVLILNEDVLKVDIRQLVETRNGGRPIKIVANLPYYITTPIIMSLFENKVPLESITVMVQKEVAERMKTGPGSKDYGALSLAVQYYACPELIANVPPNCFMPRPKVGSAVIKLTRHEKPPVNVEDEDLLFRLIRASFNQRRKTLVNSLNNAFDIIVPKETVAKAVAEMGLPPSVRGEVLTLEQFAELANRLEKKQKVL